MTDLTTPAPGGETADISPVEIAPAPAGEGEISPRDAARALAKWRVEKTKQPDKQEQEESAEPAAPSKPVEESASQEEETAAPLEAEAPGEETAAATEPEETLPPIEPPRSWKAEEKERFKSLPRDTQEYLAQREQERERELRTRQNEAAEQRKAVEAERDAVAKARQQYEAALPILLENLTAQQAGEFADLKTMQDVQRMANEDFPRYVRWDAWQKQVAAVQMEIKASQERKTSEEQKAWTDFAKEQDKLFAEKVPELADPDKTQKLQKAAVDTLKELGFSDDELVKMWNGQERISIRDHRLQLLVRNAVRLKEGQAKVQAAVKKPLPPVQKPGTAQPRQAAVDQQIKELEKKFERTGHPRDGAALLAARRKAASR